MKYIFIFVVVLFLTSCKAELNDSTTYGTYDADVITTDSILSDVAADPTQSMTNESLDNDMGNDILEGVLYVAALFDADLSGLISNPHEIYNYRSRREDIYTYKIINGEKVMLETPEYFPQEPNEYQQEAIWFMCDEEAIRKCFKENGIAEVKNIIIYDIDASYGNAGLAIAAETADSLYFMTVPMGGEKYGEYEYQKIFTAEEFYELYQPKEAKLIVNNQEIQCNITPIIGDNQMQVELFPLLNALNCEYEYNEEINTIYFNGFEVVVQTREEDNDRKVLFKRDTEERCSFLGTFNYVNDSIVIDHVAASSLIRYLGFRMEFRLDNYTINITC